MSRTSAIPAHPLGQHIIADFHGARHLTDGDAIFAAMRDAAEAAGAIVVGERHHRFGAGDGVTGVVLLAESHVSIHTWPEYNYAAIDIFMCGPKVAPMVCLERLESFFKPERSEVTRLSRGHGLAQDVENLRQVG